MYPSDDSPQSPGWLPEARRVAQGIRRRVLEHTVAHNGGYLSQACSSAEILAALYTHLMKLGPSVAPRIPPAFAGVPGRHNFQAFTGAGYNGPRSPKFDRFFLSAVHYALPLYATLVEVGRMDPAGLAQFNQDGSTVEMIGAEHSPGLEVTGGSLGQTLSQAGGVALARRLKGDSGRVWALMSDGEFQSGQTWEAIQALAFHRLDQVAIYVDVNGQQCDGKMDDVMRIEPLHARLEAFGARVVSVDGHDLAALAGPADWSPNGRPLAVLCYTNPAQGLPLLEGRRPQLHYVRFRDNADRQRFADYLAEMSN